ncbi:DUF4352 domain-containing protein [Lysinibacillus fusiformis]|uniref:DUF4352 domain-containing protein n=1 Tax=Lysinibacillus fusiformis TaxID=28031 RepID=UPI00046A02CE|nr:DUF4352 domain-containing protein [Lysinibacillus fusiformis]MCR8855307.1 DUF4352 domain-containing protein [Lysinibacillus fusiformis]WKT76075.1 DUF4352 domain-containing protein [Lysinibacillus fusiformis]
MKKPFYKKWWFILIVVIIVLGAIGNMAGENDTTKEKDANDKVETSAKTPENKDSSKEDEKEEIVGVGTPLEVGDATFTLNGVELADQVGPSVLPTKASGKYIVVDVTYKNNGNKAVTIDASYFKLKRGEKTYESDSVASMSANQGEDGNIQNSFFLQEVNPDMEIKGKVVFDLAPEVAEATDLQLQVQTGIFGTETGMINLK